MLTTHRYQPMGSISDRFKKQFAEMQIRHAETDRQIAVMIAEAHEALDELKESTAELEALLED